MYQLTYKKQALKALAKLPAGVRSRVDAAPRVAGGESGHGGRRG
jgi:mRNA-degrading endonuclease RelE of RelBE toxin-antitoxin system